MATSAPVLATSTSPAISSDDTSDGESEEGSGEAHEASTEEDVAADSTSGGDLGAEVIGTSADTSIVGVVITAALAEDAGISAEDPFPDVLDGGSSPDAPGTSPPGGSPSRVAAEKPESSSRRVVSVIQEDDDDVLVVARVAASAEFPLYYGECQDFVLFTLAFALVSLFSEISAFVLNRRLAIGSLARNLASKEEVASGSRIGRAGLDGEGLPPPRENMPPLCPKGPRPCYLGQTWRSLCVRCASLPISPPFL